MSRVVACIALLVSLFTSIFDVWAKTAYSYVFTLAPQYVPDAWMRGGERFPSGAVVYLVVGGRTRRIAPDFYLSADAVVSYDGTRVLFSGKRARTEPAEIWEAPVAGGPPHRIAACGTDCMSPLYLPDGRVVYTRRVKCGTVLETVQPSCGSSNALTFAPGWYLTDDILSDGRILIEVAQSVSNRTQRDLYTIHPDGTGVELLRSDPGHDRAQGRQVSSGDVVFEENGRLALIRPALAVQTELSQPKGEVFGPVAEASHKRWLLSLKPAGAQSIALCVLDSGDRRLTKIETSSDANAVQPAIIAPRTPPRDLPSALPASTRWANVLCLNARQTGQKLADAMDKIRVYGQDASGRTVALGQTGLYRDGSFFVQVEGDRPLRFEILDSEGRSVRLQRRWIWLRAGEQRICTGCHAGPAQAIENHLPEVLRLGHSPVSMIESSQLKP